MNIMRPVDGTGTASRRLAPAVFIHPAIPLIQRFFRSERTKITLVKLTTIVVFFIVWEALSRSGLFYQGVMPSTAAIFSGISGEIVDKGFYVDLGVTALAAAVGFLSGSIIAIGFGVWLGKNSFAHRAIEPYITAIGGAPKIIFLPILFLVFGLGIESKMAKGAISTFFPVVISTTYGFLTVKPVFLNVGKSFYLSSWQMATKIYLPAMISPILTGLRLGLAMSIIGILAAEISYSNAGLGHRVTRYADNFNVPSMYGVIILIFIISAVLNSGISKIHRHYSRHEATFER
jgi:ABC-type nitrate/sulfonate/bicarbonate transport system permease component